MNKKVLVVVGLAVFGLTLFGLTKASAYRGDYTKVGPNHTEARETQMQKIMEERNYEAWKALMTQDGRQPGVVRKIQNQEEFNKFAEAYKLGKEGRTAEATALRQQLGLGNGQGRRGGGKGNGVCGRIAQ